MKTGEKTMTLSFPDDTADENKFFILSKELSTALKIAPNGGSTKMHSFFAFLKNFFRCSAPFSW
jgi:hypothetical protein